MSGLAAARAALAQAKRDNAEFFLPLKLQWSDGVTRAFKVTDPNRLSTTAPTQLSTDPIPASLRLVKFGPDDALPAPGASVQGPEGLLVLGMFTDAGNLFGTRVGVCRLVDARAYPTAATTASDAALQLRITALNGPALTTEGHGASANDSHRGHLPPGVQLTPGEVLSTTDGDHYRVVPPIQRDSLGDTVGLSWLGRGARPPELPPVPNPDPTTPPASPDPDPGTPGGGDWWNEGLP